MTIGRPCEFLADGTLGLERLNIARWSMMIDGLNGHLLVSRDGGGTTGGGAHRETCSLRCRIEGRLPSLPVSHQDRECGQAHAGECERSRPTDQRNSQPRDRRQAKALKQKHVTSLCETQLEWHEEEGQPNNLH